MSHKDEPLLTARPYLERQLIVVSQKEILKAAEEESHRRLSDQKLRDFDWLDFSASVAKNLINVAPVNIAITIGIEAFKAWSKARASGLPLLPVSIQQAEGLSFPPGHPREGIVYVGHPSIPNLYYTMADFHRHMFEHKLSEAVEILMSLGATSIRAEHISGWARDFASKASLPTPTPVTTVSADVSYSSTQNSNMLFSANLSGTTAASLPENLIWYNHEPTWRMIAKGRILHGLRDFCLNVSYLDDFGINVSIKAALTKAGIELGGKFEGHESTVWKLSGEFNKLVRPEILEPTETSLQGGISNKKKSNNSASLD